MSLFGASDVTRGCPPELELSRALSLGSTAALSAHLAACARCAALARRLARPGELARELPVPLPTAASREQTRTSLLASLAAERAALTPARGPARRLLFLAAPFAVAAAVVVGWRFVPRTRRSPAVTASTGVAAPTSGRPAKEAEVAALPALGDGRRATAEEHAAAAPRRRAEVYRTSVRPQVAGERLEPRLAPTPGEAAFVEAWAAFRAGRFGGAINAFDDVLRLEPAGPLAEDASYWRAVALARTGAPGTPGASAAIDALGAFLRRYPGSAHAGDASLLLGWQLLAAGRRDEAAHFFGGALQARSAETRARAREGLDAASAAPRGPGVPTTSSPRPFPSSLPSLPSLPSPRPSP